MPLRKHYIGLAAATLLFACGAALSATAQDHPLISAYPGSTLTRGDTKAFAEYKLVTGYDAKQKKLLGKSLEGKLTRNHYQNPTRRSVLEIYKNYERALQTAGAEILFTCANTECGPSWASSMWNRFNGIKTFTPQNARYIAAHIKNAAGADAYVAIMIGKRRSSIDVLEPAAMEQGLVVVDAEQLGKGLDRKGYVIVQGIYFDTDKAILKPDSKPALEQTAKLLKDRPALKLFVVGHTDMQGDFNHNLELSRQRARAVVQALVQDYAIAANRLEGHGVGPLAPQASNASDAGRAANRRVVLVAR